MSNSSKSKHKVGHTSRETKVIHIAFDKSVLDEIKATAQASGLTAAAWVRMTAIREAKACV